MIWAFIHQVTAVRGTHYIFADITKSCFFCVCVILEDVPPFKKSNPFEDLFGDTFCTVDPSQTVKTLKELAYAEVVKYRDTASLNASERVFSTAGDIVISERSVLYPEHVDQLIFF